MENAAILSSDASPLTVSPALGGYAPGCFRLKNYVLASLHRWSAPSKQSIHRGNTRHLHFLKTPHHHLGSPPHHHLGAHRTTTSGAHHTTAARASRATAAGARHTTSGSDHTAASRPRRTTASIAHHPTTSRSHNTAASERTTPPARERTTPPREPTTPSPRAPTTPPHREPTTPPPRKPPRHHHGSPHHHRLGSPHHQRHGSPSHHRLGSAPHRRRGSSRHHHLGCPPHHRLGSPPLHRLASPPQHRSGSRPQHRLGSSPHHRLLPGQKTKARTRRPEKTFASLGKDIRSSQPMEIILAVACEGSEPNNSEVAMNFYVNSRFEHVLRRRHSRLDTLAAMADGPSISDECKEGRPGNKRERAIGLRAVVLKTCLRILPGQTPGAHRSSGCDVHFARKGYSQFTHNPCRRASRIRTNKSAAMPQSYPLLHETTCDSRTRRSTYVLIYRAEASS